LALQFFYPSALFAVNLSLAWDHNHDSSVWGYIVYLREEWQSYDYSFWACHTDEKLCVIYSIEYDIKYCSVVRAYNEYGESPDSAELCFIIYPLDNDYDNDCDIDGSDLANGGFQDFEDLASNYGLIGCPFDEMNQNK
jgi:hypothetical protein